MYMLDFLCAIQNPRVRGLPRLRSCRARCLPVITVGDRRHRASKYAQDGESIDEEFDDPRKTLRKLLYAVEQLDHIYNANVDQRMSDPGHLHHILV